MDLTTAFARRQQHLIPDLLAAGADVNQVGRRGITPLLYAAIQNNPALIRLFIEAGADVNAVREGGLTALFDTVTHGDIESIDLLLRHGANARHKNERGESVLKWVMCHNLALRYALLTRLIAAGADPNGRNKYGHIDLWGIFIYPEDDPVHCQAIFDLQIKHGLKLRRMEEGETLLHAATQVGSIDAVCLLIKNRIGLETRDRRLGFTALHFATVFQHQAVLELLLGYSANIEARDREGATPFFKTQDPLFWKNIGANIDARDNAGRTCLMRHCLCAPLPPPVDTSQMHTETALRHRSMERALAQRVERAAAQIKQLLELGVNPSIRDKKGCTALHLAIKNQHPSLIALLRESQCCD